MSVVSSEPSLTRPLHAPFPASWKRGWTEQDLARRISQGFGGGALAEHRPWLGVHDSASSGVVTRIWSPKTGRMMHFFSLLERDLFLELEFRADFYDYWEQCGLQRALTIKAARDLGYKHPIYKGSQKIPLVMTTDGILFQRKAVEKIKLTAFDCKVSSENLSCRSRELLAISRDALAEVGIDHHLITRSQLCEEVAKNLLWIRGGYRRTGERELVAGQFDVLPLLMQQQLRHEAQNALESSRLTDFCIVFSRQRNVPPAIAIRVLKYLFWHHLVEADLKRGAIIRQPTRDLRFPE